jgi:chromosome segregation ATPase
VAIDATARGGREEEKLPDPRSLRDSAAKHAVEALLEARRELADVMKRSPGQIQRYTEMALVAVPELEQHAAQLVGRAEELGAYLSSVSADSIRRDVKQLQAQAEQTSDATAREQFEQARAAREEQLRTLQELAEARQRLEGHLSRLVATYQSLPARVVHLRTLDAQAADTLSAGVNLELDRMNNEISAFEQTLKELSARVPA